MGNSEVGHTNIGAGRVVYQELTRITKAIRDGDFFENPVLLEAVRRALAALDSGLTPDAVLTDAEEALESIGELTGRTAKEEIVGAVFSRFCVGK